MKKALWVLLVMLIAAFGYCAYRYYNEAYLPKKELAADIQKAQELNESIRPEIIAEDKQNDEPVHDNLEKARLLDENVAAWVSIPGTTIDYPIVQGTDNSYFLTHTLDGEYNQHGTPFLDVRCDPNFEGLTSIVYGHHFYNDDSIVFGALYYYKSKDYMAQHPTATLILPYEVHEVKLFAYLNVNSTSNAYTAKLETQQDKQDYLDYLFDTALYTTIERSKLNADSRLLLLSTCTGEYWEARGVLVGVIE